jgi:hypothetical protein
MKSSIKTLFVILAILISFVAMQAVWAGGGPNGPIPSCSGTVEGSATMIDGLDAIDVAGITIYGIPAWLDLEDIYVVVTYFESPDGKYVACYLIVDYTTIYLRGRGPE